MQATKFDIQINKLPHHVHLQTPQQKKSRITGINKCVTQCNSNSFLCRFCVLFCHLFVRIRNSADEQRTTPDHACGTFIAIAQPVIKLAIHHLNFDTNQITTKFHEAESFLRSHQSLSYSRISQLLWSQQTDHRVHRSPPLVLILSQTKSVHTTPSYFAKMSFNIILPCMSGPICIHPHLNACYMPCPSHPH
jgi:hypothetical protein